MTFKFIKNSTTFLLTLSSQTVYSCSRVCLNLTEELSKDYRLHHLQVFRLSLLVHIYLLAKPYLP